VLNIDGTALVRLVGVDPKDANGRIHYRFGNCAVRTSLPLASLRRPFDNIALRTIDVDLIDQGISSGAEWHHHWRDGDEVVLSLVRCDDDYWLRAPGVADFLIQMQLCRVQVAPQPGMDACTVEHLLVDQVLPRVLAQQGETMVHASALSIGGRHALFLGPSGWGKSTLAGLLHRYGHVVLSDDCVQLVAEGNRFRAIPTYPSLRLYADSLDELFPGQVETAPVASYTSKRRVPMEARHAPEQAVDAIYLLGDPAHADESIRIAPLRPAETCLALIRHSFRLDLGDRAASAAQLARCAEVARSVPGFRLDYPRDFTRQGELAEAVISHVATLPALP